MLPDINSAILIACEISSHYPKIKLEIAVRDDMVDKVVQAIVEESIYGHCGLLRK